MQKLQLEKLQNEVQNYPMFHMTYDQFLKNTIIETCSYMLAGYENTVTDSNYDNAQAIQHFYKTAYDCVEAIRKEIRRELEHYITARGLRFKGNAFINDVIIAHLKYDYAYLLVDVDDVEMLDTMDLKKVTFDFSKCWAVRPDTPADVQ